MPPLVGGISLILFVYGLVQKYILFPIYLNRLQSNETFYSQALVARVKSGRVFALFSLPTLYALVVSVLLIFILHYFLSSAWPRRWFWLLLLLLGVFNLLLSQSFGGIAYCALAVLFYLFATRTLKIGYLAPLLMVLSLVFFIVLGLRFSEARELGPLKLRFSNWLQAGRLIAQAPVFGVGLGNYESEIPPHIRPGEAASVYAHNFPLQWLAETGVLATAAVFLLTFLAIIRERRRWFEPQSLLFSSALILIACYNLLDIGNYFFAAGLVTALCLSQIFPSGRRTRPLTVLTLAGLACTLLLAEWSESVRRQADFQASQQEYENAARTYARSLRINPFAYRPFLGLALIQRLQKNDDAAQYWLERFLALDPQMGYANFLISVMHFQKGRYLSALYFAEEARRANRLSRQYQKWQATIHADIQNQISGTRN